MLKTINNKIALTSVGLMSSIWCVYLFTIWSLLPSVFPDLQNLVFYVSGGVIQLVALPLIMVGQNLIGANAEQRAQEDHERLIEILKDAEEQRKITVEILSKLEKHLLQ